MKSYKVMIATVNIVLAYAFPAYASNLSNTKLVTGTQTLITVITGILTAFAVGITIVFAVKDVMVWQQANDQEAPSCKKKLIRDIGLGILIVTIGGVITAVLAIYQ